MRGNGHGGAQRRVVVWVPGIAASIGDMALIGRDFPPTLAVTVLAAGALAAGGCGSDPEAPPGSLASGPVDIIASDTASSRDPLPFWGEAGCAARRRASRVREGGDTHRTASGAKQRDSAFRRLTVVDGDDAYGERCELGLNDWRTGRTVFYREGRRVDTYLSLRLPSNYPLEESSWQVVMQMKQTQPSNNGGGTPALALEASGGRWRLTRSASAGASGDSSELWSAPARTGFWTRFALDAVYSRSAQRGSIAVHADLNGDGDFEDEGERSGVLRGFTLKRETQGSLRGFAPGSSIPAHLRAGIYHDPAIPCPAPAGCSVDLDNVQVVAR